MRGLPEKSNLAYKPCLINNKDHNPLLTLSPAIKMHFHCHDIEVLLENNTRNPLNVIGEINNQS